ncbi:MAG: M48 family metallopeptidase, partial [Planctomycetes bacterium]|nr:M48 family metallopeptidase [Planctomycetota bacterium]
DPDGATQNLIADIGSRLAACVKNKQRSFQFAAVESAEPNAFALPGGFIYITSGLLELCCCTPDEIAFVLAHEMAHVIRGHPMERIVSDSAVTTLSRVAPLRGVLGAWLKRVGIQFLQSAYSQDRELEADRLGTRLLKAAHFNGDAAADLFRRLAEIDQRGQLAELSSYFSSHPQLPDRIAAVTAAAKKQKR